MPRRVSPTLIGAFVVGGLALLAAAIIVLAGSDVFTRKERTVMHFDGSVYGLQVGAPVVFRGVRVGSVASIDVFYDRDSDTFSIPVIAELDGAALSGLGGSTAAAPDLPALIERGLTAQLSTQSLLTGLLYVDLDLREGRQGELRGTHGGLIEIPTTPTAIQALRDQLEGLDLRRMADDLSAIAASARALVAGPELKRALSDVAEITANVKRLSQRLDERVDPLADELERSLATARVTVQELGKAAQGVTSTVERFGTASDRMADLLAPDSPLVQDLARAADEIARSAAALRQATDGDSRLMRDTERTLEDVSTAARALRELAETLAQRPESLLRGRRGDLP